MPAFPFRAALLTALAFASPVVAFAGGLDDAVLAELNYARAHPDDYARELRQQLRASGDDDPDAVEEAIAFLEHQPALPPLARDSRIAAAAHTYAAAQGLRGDLGHGPAGGLGQRLRDNGVWAGLSAEDISYGYDEPRAVVRQMIVDSGVPGRGHRRNIFSGSYSVAGVACGPHRTYRAMCVIDFAGAIVQR